MIKKSLLIFFCCLGVLACTAKPTECKVRASLGGSMTKGIVDSIDIRSEARGDWKKEEVEFEIYHYTYRSRTDELIDADRRINELQVNYYLSQLPDGRKKEGTESLVFVGGGSYYDNDFNTNEIQIGIGAGLNYYVKELTLRAEGGLYAIDEPTDQVTSAKIKGKAVYNITENIELEPIIELERNLDRDLWSGILDAKIRFKSGERISLVFGIEEQYDEAKNLKENSIERYYTAVELSL